MQPMLESKIKLNPHCLQSLGARSYFKALLAGALPCTGAFTCTSSAADALKQRVDVALAGARNLAVRSSWC